MVVSLNLNTAQAFLGQVFRIVNINNIIIAFTFTFAFTFNFTFDSFEFTIIELAIFAEFLSSSLFLKR